MMARFRFQVGQTKRGLSSQRFSLSSEVGLANWPDNLVSRIDMIQEFQRSDMMLGGFDFYLADGVVVTVAEYN